MEIDGRHARDAVTGDAVLQRRHGVLLQQVDAVNHLGTAVHAERHVVEMSIRARADGQVMHGVAAGKEGRQRVACRINHFLS